MEDAFAAPALTSDAAERFRAIYDAYYSAVLRYAWRRIGPDAAADVAAEVFVVVWRRLDEVPPDPLPWLLGVARRVVANTRRGAERAARLHDRVAAEHLVGTLARTITHDPAETVAGDARFAAAFAQLSDEHREALELVVWEELSARQAAEVAGCSVPAFAMRLHRARARLRAELAEQDGE